MCFNAPISFLTFVIGLVGSYGLIKYGNKKYKKENTVFGIFFIFIASIQLMDFLLWIDIKNKIGINHLTTIIGPLLNVGQPLILYLIKYFYYKPEINLTNTFYIYAIFNIFYFIYLITMYSKFLLSKSGSLVTSTSNGHLSWPWIPYANSTLYLIVLALNIFYLTNFTYSLISFIIVYLFLTLSYYLFFYNTGELWCFFGAFIPFILLFVSYCI
jgi:hypothetical protein